MHPKTQGVIENKKREKFMLYIPSTRSEIQSRTNLSGMLFKKVNNSWNVIAENTVRTNRIFDLEPGNISLSITPENDIQMPCSFSSASDEKEMQITEEQRLLAEYIDSHSGPIEAKWINSYTIDVTYSPSRIDILTESEIQKKAEMIAKMGGLITKKETCAKITDYKGKELAYKCVGNTPS